MQATIRNFRTKKHSDIDRLETMRIVRGTIVIMVAI